MSQTILRPSVSTTSLRRAQKKLAAIEHRGVLETRLFASRLRARASRAFKNGEKLQILDIVLKSLPALRDAMIASHLLGTIAYSTPRDLALSSVYSPLIKVLKAQSTANYNKLQKLYGTRALKVLNGVSKAAESELRGTVNELVEKGSHVSEAIDVLGEKIESLGLAPKKDYQLEAIFRTQSQIAFGAGRWEADKDPAVQEILWGYEYSATMDDRTRESHAALDGVKLPKDDPFWEKFWPPNGWNCRCVAIPIFSDEAVEVEPPDDVEPDEGFDFNPGIVFGSGKGTSLGLSHDFEDGWRMAFDPDQPRDEGGQWTSTGGGGRGGSKDASSKLSRKAVDVMEKYKNESAWREPIREFMEANDLSIDDYESANGLLYAHNVQSGGKSEQDLIKAWESDTRTGKALRAMSEWQEWQVRNKERDAVELDTSYLDKQVQLHGWDNVKKNFSGGDLVASHDELKRLWKAEAAGETIFYRKGGLDRKVISTSTDPKGADTGAGRFKPDHWFTIDDMKANGYKLISGSRGVVGVTSTKEREYIWIKDDASVALAFDPDQPRDSEGQWTETGTSGGKSLAEIKKTSMFKQAKTAGFKSKTKDPVALAKELREFYKENYVKPEDWGAVDDLGHGKVTKSASSPHSSAEKWAKSLDDDDASILWGWHHGDSRDIQKSEREGGEEAERFNEILDKAPKYSGTVYRGLSGLSDKTMKSYVEGGVLKIENSESASVDEDVGKKFANWDPSKKGHRVLLKIKSKTGVEVGKLFDPEEEEDPEQEVILRRSSSYKITKVAKGKVTLVEAEEVEGLGLAFDPDQPRDEDGRWTSTGASNPHPAVKKMKDKVSKSIYNKLAAINDKGLKHNTIYVPNAMSKEEIMVLEKYLHPGQKIKKINAAKYIKQQKEAKAPPPVLEPKISPDLGTKTSSFNVLEKLGGSTGAELVEMSDGSLKVKKSGASKEHVKSEHAADRAYAAAGVKVASGYLTKDPETGHTIKLAGFIKGKTLGELSGEERVAAEKQLAKGFMADVLLANYDAVGMNADNVIVNDQGAWRIDNGGSLSFRAQGEKKTNWTEHSILDLDKMSNSLYNPQMAKIAKHLTKVDMAQQVKDLRKNIISIKSVLSSEDAGVVEKRLKNLEDYLGVSHETPKPKLPPKLPPTTGGQHAVVAIAKGIGTTKGVIAKLEAINTDPGSKVIQVPKSIKTVHLDALKKAFPEHVFKLVNAAAIIKKKYKENFPDSEKQSIGVKASAYDGSQHVVKATNAVFMSHAQDKGFKNELTDELKQLNKKWIEGLSSSTRAAIKSWTGTGSTAIRASQLKGKPNKEAKLIEAAIAKAPKAEGVFYRGIKHVSAEALTKMTTVGAEFPEKCTHSMSRSYDFARGWASGKILMRIKTKSAVSIETLGIPSEYELYGSAYTRYKVVAVHEKQNGVARIIDVEEIPNGQ